jgi:mannitol/fructose-specific phosphotransferase system IIA component (Ntr-type)/Kef-type K+ transport system membrane component KefB
MDIEISTELIFFIVAFGGFAAGKLFQRLKLPEEYGQILLGLTIGPSGAYFLSKISGVKIDQLISPHNLHSLGIVSQSAMGILTFTIGSYLSKHSLHNAGKRIIQFATAHTIVTYFVVYFSLTLFTNTPHQAALLLAAIAVAVAPGPVISAIQRENARGIFTKTVLGVVAFSNFSTILIFDFTRSAIILNFADSSEFSTPIHHFFILLSKPILTVLWGAAIGYLAAYVTQHLHKRGEISALLFFAILFNIIFASFFDFSPMLINLITGIVFTNKSYHTPVVLDFFTTVEGILISAFFTLAGTHLDITTLPAAGLAGVVFIVSRVVAQWSSAFILTKVAGYSKSIGNYLGFALIPKAELAIGLFVSLTHPAFAEYAPLMSAVVLASVVVNELVGPFAVSASLRAANESGQATPRLIDFLHEEFILMPLKSRDKWEAIETMSQFLIDSNHIKHLTSKQLHKIVVEREKEFPTALGEQIAVPHARIEGNHKLMGVIGICPIPIEFDAFDKKPVDIVILVATPEGKSDMHVRLLATIARIFSNKSLHNSIVAAKSTAEVYDLLQTREVRGINSYIEELS